MTIGFGRRWRAGVLALAAMHASAFAGAQMPDLGGLLQALPGAGGGGGGGGGGAAGGGGGAAGGLKAPAQSGSTELVAVSADIVEISGSVQTQAGFGWTQTLEFGETTVPFPGLIRVGEFARKTALATQLRLFQTEGKAQLLSNPRVIVKSGEQANFVVGGEQPYPQVGATGTAGTDFKKFGVILNVLPVLLQDEKETIAAQIQLEVSNPDFSKTIQVGGSAVPSLITRQLQTTVEMKSGDTLVLGGLKRSERNVSKTRVPVLGRIPLLGALFTSSDVTESTSSLYLFMTLEKAK